MCLERGPVLLARFASPVTDVAGLRRSSLVDVGLALARIRPPSGHVDPVAVGVLVQH